MRLKKNKNYQMEAAITIGLLKEPKDSEVADLSVKKNDTGPDCLSGKGW